MSTNIFDVPENNTLISIKIIRKTLEECMTTDTDVDQLIHDLKFEINRVNTGYTFKNPDQFSHSLSCDNEESECYCINEYIEEQDYEHIDGCYIFV